MKLHSSRALRLASTLCRIEVTNLSIDGHTLRIGVYDPKISLFDRLCSIAGEDNVSIDPRNLQAHSRDPSPFPPITPGIIVTPTRTEIVSQIIEMCNETKSPILPFGAGYSFTGLSNRRGTLHDSHGHEEDE